jgi:chitin disaccharide deacetylase
VSRVAGPCGVVAGQLRRSVLLGRLRLPGFCQSRAKWQILIPDFEFRIPNGAHGHRRILLKGHTFRTRSALKTLIVNGDDFGLSPQVNAGILRAHSHGILTSTSLMVAEPSCTEAVAAARDYPGLDVGLHLVCCNGRSVLPARQLRGLVDDAGCFPRSEVRAGIRYGLQRALRPKLRSEFRAQVDRHLALVRYLNHINCHHNLHLHPALIDIVLDLASEYRVPYIRLVREPLFASLALARDHPARKLRDHFIFWWLSARARRLMAPHAVSSNDWTFGFHQTGHLSEDYLVGALARLPEGATTEFYFHPSVEAAGKPPLWPSQTTETELLTSPRTRAVVKRLEIRLTTFRELALEPQQA